MNPRNLFGTVACTFLVLVASSATALGQSDQMADHLLTGDREDSPLSISPTMADQSQSAGCCDVGYCPSCCCPRWTASADFIILDRIGSVNQTLVETVQGTVKYKDLRHTAGTEVLNSNDFQEGFSGGPRLDLIRHGDNGYDLEVVVFSDRRLEQQQKRLSR